MSNRPGVVRLAAALALLAVLGAVGRAEAQPVRVALVDHRQPTFFTCVISDGQGTVPAGKHVIQTISLQGSHFRLNQATGK